ncbi:4-alpha-glucanotransferase [Sulfuriroseicoccus oceanibius]|uniref:4-alpha-glucanotransferase n=1 Tax=Sulfuriroseicoccus oceanibius TaxID=2707525 RepID=A0A6B3L598_9BACT|nr:4-alpha-glucanotransferase [Sulfuriroseicoccus oceanibius]QQL44868.1 4-alpha-glucanotransferase [Sulfuriroseicoccus oceanibius]
MSIAKYHERCSGVVAPLFALRHENDWGIGDSSTLMQFIDWAAKAGVKIVQLLPINEGGGDHSPYNAISSVALDPVYADVSDAALVDLPEDAHGEQPMSGGNVLNVDYHQVLKVKVRRLRSAYDSFVENAGAQRKAAFDAFREQESEWLEDYCIFRYLMQREGGSECWDRWSSEYNTIEKARAFVPAQADSAHELGYFAYVQWVLWDQFHGVRGHAEGRGVYLMGDIPFGVSYYSADVFAEPGQFNLEWSGGAPPEKVFKDDDFVIKWGQNWGIPLYRWDVMKANDYRWWKRRVTKTCEVFNLFRIDHVLGFFRIYAFPWRPERNQEFLPLSQEEAMARTGGKLPGFVAQGDDTEADREANRAAGMEYLRMVQEVAASAGAGIIAEDLGTVPPYVRPALLDLGIPGTKVPQWEHTDGRFTDGSRYEECTLATYATHDHEPMATLWERLRRDMHDAPTHDERQEAGEQLYHFRLFAGMDVESPIPAYDDAVKEQLLHGLCLSHSRYAVIMINDFLGSSERFNVPGVAGVQNWSQRLPMTVKELMTAPRWVDVTQRMRMMFEQTGRA